MIEEFKNILEMSANTGELNTYFENIQQISTII
jgi:hypothetical protein